MGKKLSIGSAIAVAALAIGTPPAAAHERSFATDIHVDDIEGEVAITGHLTSPKEGCLPGRTVKLFAVDSGPTSSESDDVYTLLGTDRTSANGAYFVEGTAPAGTDEYLLRVTKKNIGGSGHRHICRANTHGIV